MNNPKVSVIIPVYNGEKFLEEAIKSVFNQDYNKYPNCIVVDDGSTDESASIAKKFERIVFLLRKIMELRRLETLGCESIRRISGIS